MDNRKYKTEEQVRDFFFETLSGPLSPVRKKEGERGIYVDTKLRREILTGQNEGKIVINGRVRGFIFTHLGGGVYICKLGD